MKPRVSICLPNLNTRSYLEPRMESILAQTNQEWELVVFDNLSDDGSWEYFQTFAKHPRVRLYQAPRAGMYANWNNCLQAAEGDFMYIATSDDTMEPDCLDQLLALADAAPDCLGAFGDYQRIDERGASSPDTHLPMRQLQPHWSGPHRIPGEFALIFHLLRIPLWVTITAGLFRKEAFAKVGMFRTDYGAHADQEFAMRLSAVSDLAYTPATVATWRVHPDQGSKAGRLAAIYALHVRIAREFLQRHEQSAVIQRWNRQYPAWRRELMDAAAYQYRQQSALFRWKLKESPREFLEEWKCAARNDPAWIRGQLARGFGWPKHFDAQPTLETTVLQLAQRLDIPWPPPPLSLDLHGTAPLTENPRRHA